MAQSATGAAGGEQEVSNKIVTLPNVISFLRLCLVPVYLVLLLRGDDLWATFAFAVAAGTDFVDGQIARRTHSVSKLGQLLDPAVDRILMITGVVGVCIAGRLPLWIVVVVVLRDLYLLVGGGVLMTRFKIRVPVIYPGKFATTFLFIGFIGLLLNWPLLPGLGVTTAAWLPGFADFPCSWGIWFVYAGLVLSIGTAVYYSWSAWNALCAEFERRRAEEPKDGAAR